MMKNRFNKTIIAAITLVLTFALAATIVVNAQYIQYTPTFLFVAASPDPVGVNQPITIVAWTTETVLPCDDDAILGAPGNREAWWNMTIELTKPDATTETLELGPSDPVGSNWITYIPDQVGTYSVQAHFPGNWKNRTAPITDRGTNRYYNYVGDFWFEAADSPIAEFVVQAEPLEVIPGVEYPSTYWTRPIDAELKRWSEIAGNWLDNGMGNPYTRAPESAHILWTKPYFFGGIVGEPFGQMSIATGSAYEEKWGGLVIMLGRAYYNVNLGGSSADRKLVCVDLRTGETLWENNSTTVSSAMLYQFDSRNQHGVHPYLWCSGNSILDPYSGTELFRYTHVPGGSSAVGPNGENLRYVIDLGEGWLALWNSTDIVSQRDTPIEVDARRHDMWRPVGKVHDGDEGYTWNITIPLGLEAGRRGGGLRYVLEDKIIGGGYWDYWSQVLWENDTQFRMWCLNMEEGHEGEKLWDVTPTPPEPEVCFKWSSVSEEDGVLVLFAKETRQFVGYNLETGDQIWETQPMNQWMMYSGSSSIIDGKLIAGGYGGEIYAFDVTNGQHLWTTSVDKDGLETAYPASPLSIQVIDGKIYARAQEHSHTQPLYRTWKVTCFDAETGDRIWDINGYWGEFGFADDCMVSLNNMDHQVYCFGKGPTKTTVSAPETVQPLGTPVLIKGMITDISAGTKETGVMTRFPNGVGVVAEDYMTDWMQYVYKQYPFPQDATGVEVTLSVLDPNGNFYEIGTATSDASGMYKMMWEPPVEGEYTVIATFGGSDSYWSSQSETALGVSEAISPGIPIEPEQPTPTPEQPTPTPEQPTPTPTPEQPTPTPTPEQPTPTPEEPGAPLISTEVAIAAAVAVAAVIGVAAYWMLRKRQ